MGLLGNVKLKSESLMHIENLVHVRQSALQYCEIAHSSVVSRGGLKGRAFFRSMIPPLPSPNRAKDMEMSECMTYVDGSKKSWCFSPPKSENELTAIIVRLHRAELAEV